MIRAQKLAPLYRRPTVQQFRNYHVLRTPKSTPVASQKKVLRLVPQSRSFYSKFPKSCNGKIATHSRLFCSSKPPQSFKGKVIKYAVTGVFVVTAFFVVVSIAKAVIRLAFIGLLGYGIYYFYRKNAGGEKTSHLISKEVVSQTKEFTKKSAPIVGKAAAQLLKSSGKAIAKSSKRYAPVAALLPLLEHMEKLSGFLKDFSVSSFEDSKMKRANPSSVKTDFDLMKEKATVSLITNTKLSHKLGEGMSFGSTDRILEDTVNGRKTVMISFPLKGPYGTARATIKGSASALNGKSNFDTIVEFPNGETMELDINQQFIDLEPEEEKEGEGEGEGDGEGDGEGRGEGRGEQHGVDKKKWGHKKR